MKQVTPSEGDISPVDGVIACFGEDAALAIPMLQAIQERYGYLPPPALHYLASKTKCTPAQLFGIVTFYSQFRSSHAGRHHIRVCNGTTCHGEGATQITGAVKQALHLEPGQTTADGLFTLEKVACLGCCNLSPVLMLDDRVYSRLTEGQAQEILKQQMRREKEE